MKFSNTVLNPIISSTFLTSSLLVVAQEACDSGCKFKLEDTYTISNLGSLGNVHAGGFIDPLAKDYLYLVGDAEYDTSEIYELKLVRNETTDKIIGIDTTVSPRVVYATPYLDHISSNKDKNGQYWFGNVTDYDPDFNCWATFDPVAQTFEHNEGDCNDVYEDPGLFGMAFLANDNLIGTSTSQFRRYTLNADNSVASHETLCSLPSYYSGGMGLIPSGTYQGSAMIADWDEGSVFILELDETTGDCINGNLTTSPPGPSLIDFVPSGETGITKAWGFLWDPLTNDFFVTAWDGDALLYHFTGFVPGVNFERIIQNIAAEAESLAIALESAYATRGLRQSSVSDQAPGKGGEDPPGQTAMGRPGRTDAPGLLTAPGLLKKCEQDFTSMWYYKLNCKDVVFDATAAEVADGITSAIDDAIETVAAGGDPHAVTEAIVSTITDPIETVLATDAFQEEVYSGGDTTEFQEYIAIISEGLAAAAESVLATVLPEEVKTEIEDRFNTIQALLALIGEAIEGGAV